MDEESMKSHSARGVDRLSDEDLRRFDESLRRDLEPHPAVVSRVVHGALQGPISTSRPRWRLVWAGAFLLLLAIAVPRLRMENPPVETSPPTAQQQLRISNDGGLVMVTTSASALVILPGDS